MAAIRATSVSKRLYKGAAPGTHWWNNDARSSGFMAPLVSTVSVNSILTHINSSPNRSPCLSFTMSYAVARQYALLGPAGPATATMPGYVYCIDLAQLPFSANVVLFDPVVEIAGSNGNLTHEHNGEMSLIAQIATTAPTFSNPPTRGGGTSPPMISPPLQALVRAIRDSEVLIEGSLAAAAIVDRDDVY